MFRLHVDDPRTIRGLVDDPQSPVAPQPLITSSIRSFQILTVTILLNVIIRVHVILIISVLYYDYFMDDNVVSNV